MNGKIIRYIIIGSIGIGIIVGIVLLILDMSASKTQGNALERPIPIIKTMGPEGVLAKVGGIEVPTKLFSEMVNQIRINMIDEGTDIDDPKNAATLTAVRQDIINELVDFAVYENYAKENKMLPTSQDIANAVASEIDAKAKAIGSVDALDKKLKEQGYPNDGIEGFRKQLKEDPLIYRQITRDKVTTHVLKDVKVSEKEAEEFFESRILGLSQIVVLYDPKIDGEELREPTRKYAQSLRDMIGKEYTFSDVAIMRSEDRTTGDNGGRIPELASKGTLPPPLDETAFKLKIGEVSQVLEAQGSFVILKLDYETYTWKEFFTDGGKKPKPKFEDVAQQVANQMYTVKRYEKENEWFEQYKDKLKIEVYLKLE